MTITTRPFRYRPEDIAAARATGGRAIPILRFVLATAVLGVVAGFGVAAMVVRGAGEDRLEIGSTPALAGWFAFAVTVAVLAAYGRIADIGQQRLDVLLHPEHRVAFDDDGVRLIAEHGETFTRWSGVATVTWSGDDLVLVTLAGVRLMVPGRALPDPSDREALLSLIAGKVAA